MKENPRGFLELETKKQSCILRVQKNILGEKDILWEKVPITWTFSEFKGVFVGLWKKIIRIVKTAVSVRQDYFE